MPGIRVDRLLASTAIALLLSGAAAGGAFADPTTAASGNAAVAAPVSAAPAAASQSETAAKPEAAQEASPATANPAATPKSDNSAAANTPAAAKPGTAGATPAAAAPTPAAQATPTPAAPSTATAGTPASSSAETAAAPAAAPAGPDAAISDQLRELANGKFDHVIVNKKDRMQIDAFYSGRNYKPLWIADGKANASATAAIAYLGHVDADGLFPSDYPVPNFAALSTPADLANAEIELTMSVITYAHHASIGRVAWSRVSADIAYDRPAPEPADVLATVADAKDVATALEFV